MDLLLWRHAEAFEAGLDQRDFDRTLTPEGESQAQRMAQWLRRVLPDNARVIASPAMRTQQTAAALGRPVETVPALVSGATVQAVLRASNWPNSPVPVLVVGHQPTLGMVAAWVLAGQRQHWSLEKAGVWWLRGEEDGLASVVAMQSPDLL